MPDYSIITSETALQTLTDEWDQLQARAGQSPFTDYGWFRACWEHLSKPQGKTLHVIAYRVDGKLVAVLPLIVGKKHGFRILQGGGSDAFYPTEILTESIEHVAVLWEMARQSRLYDFAMIRDIDTASASDAALKAFARRHAIDKAPYLKIEHKTGKEWMESLPRKIRTESRRRMRRLEERGKVNRHVHTNGPLPSNILDGMIRTKMTWCIKHGKHGLFDCQGIGKFFEQIVNIAAMRKQLSFSWLQCGDSVIAYHLGFIHNDKFYAYLITYDPEWMPYSPGNLNTIETIQWAIDKGMSEFDFLQGDGRYKLDFTNNSREYAEWTFSSSAVGQLKEYFYILLRGLKRKLKSDAATPPG